MLVSTLTCPFEFIKCYYEFQFLKYEMGGYVAQMTEMGNVYKSLVAEPVGVLKDFVWGFVLD
jgi:hypothetical protein